MYICLYQVQVFSFAYSTEICFVKYLSIFFIIFLLSKANFGIKDYTENIHKIPTPRNREKDYSRILPERQAKETLLEFQWLLVPLLFCIMNTSSSHKTPFNNQTVKNPSLCSIYVYLILSFMVHNILSLSICFNSATYYILQSQNH